MFSRSPVAHRRRDLVTYLIRFQDAWVCSRSGGNMSKRTGCTWPTKAWHAVVKSRLRHGPLRLDGQSEMGIPTFILLLEAFPGIIGYITIEGIYRKHLGEDTGPNQHAWLKQCRRVMDQKLAHP
jgi:hypothetical protein